MKGREAPTRAAVSSLCRKRSAQKAERAESGAQTVRSGWGWDGRVWAGEGCDSKGCLRFGTVAGSFVFGRQQGGAASARGGSRTAQAALVLPRCSASSASACARLTVSFAGQWGGGGQQRQFGRTVDARLARGEPRNGSRRGLKGECARRAAQAQAHGAWSVVWQAKRLKK